MKANKYLIFLVLFCFIYLLNFGIHNAQGQDLKEEGFSLVECISLAINNGFEVKLARLDFLIAETNQTAAEAIYDTLLSMKLSYEKDRRQPLSIFGADDAQTNIYSIEAKKKLPSGTEVTFSLDDTRTWTNSGFVSSNPAHTSEATLEARQPIGKNIFGYIDRRNISLTSLAILNADLDTKERIEVMLAEVEKAYWQWVFSKENLGIYRKILEKAKNLHQANAKNYDIGNIEKGNFLASQANVLIREKDVLIAENQYRSAEEKIKLLMNMEADDRLYPIDDLQYKEIEISLQDCLAQAFQKRRDYHQAKRDVEIKNILLETKSNARWPEIDLVASFAANGIDSEFGRAFNNITSDGNADYYAGIEISIPLENNLAQSEFEKAQHNKEKMLIGLKQIERAIITEIGDAFRNYITYKANFVKLEEATQLQYEKLTEEERRFQYGRSSTKRLIDYQHDYLNAQLQLAQCLLGLESAKVNLEKSLNVILEKYEGLL